MTTTRRELLTAAGAGALVAPFAGHAQQPSRLPVIGVLSPFNDNSTFLAEFREGLRRYDYVEGRNIRIEYRSTGGKAELIPVLAEELIGRKVDVIVTSSAPAVQFARQATNRIPIVVARIGDAVDQGVVAGFARPGSNVTGLSWLAPELTAKSLEILKEAFPRMSHVAIFREAAAGAASALAADAAARRLGMNATIFQARTPDEFETTFAAMKNAKVDGLIVLEGLMTFNNSQAIAALAGKARLPAIFFDSAFVDVGGLMSYGPNFADMHRRAAYFVDRILKGAHPGDLSVQQPTKFDLAINLGAARTLGIRLPEAILLRADRIVE